MLTDRQTIVEGSGSRVKTNWNTQALTTEWIIWIGKQGFEQNLRQFGRHLTPRMLNQINRKDGSGLHHEDCLPDFFNFMKTAIRIMRKSKAPAKRPIK